MFILDTLVLIIYGWGLLGLVSFIFRDFGGWLIYDLDKLGFLGVGYFVFYPLIYFGFWLFTGVERSDTEKRILNILKAVFVISSSVAIQGSFSILISAM